MSARKNKPEFLSGYVEDIYSQDLLDKALDHWSFVIEHLENIGANKPCVLKIAESLVLTELAASHLEPSALAEGPTLTSDNGNEYANQKWAALRNLKKEVVCYQRELLISPDKAGAVSTPKTAKSNLAADEFL